MGDVSQFGSHRQVPNQHRDLAASVASPLMAVSSRPRSDDDEPLRARPTASLTSPFDVTNRALPPPLPADVRQTTVPRDYSVEVVRQWEDLADQVPLWDDLSAHAAEPNVFYSSFALLAAMRHLKPVGTSEFLVIRATDRGKPFAPPIWCGFFPFVRQRRIRGVPANTLRCLHHDYCFLRSPLVRADCTGEVLGLLFDWLRESRAAVVEFGEQPGEGAYAQSFAGQFLRLPGKPWLASSHPRALLVRRDSDEEYLRASISGGKLQELRRLERRLSDQGEIRYDGAIDDSNLDSRIHEFLDLEASGWKGRNGTAMACSSAHRSFFVEMTKQAHSRGLLRLLTLRLNGKAIASKCNLMSPPGAFAFKIAFDEQFARFSPGQLLEIENIRRMHVEPGVQWMDSCAAPGHSMIEQLWAQRRIIQNWVVPVGRWGRCLAASLPLFQWARRSFLRPPTQSKEPSS